MYGAIPLCLFLGILQAVPSEGHGGGSVGSRAVPVPTGNRLRGGMPMRVPPSSHLPWMCGHLLCPLRGAAEN